MLDLVRVDVYGQKMPINQLGSITTPEPRSINIQVWDTNNVALIDSAIKKAELGLNPQIPIPEYRPLMMIVRLLRHLQLCSKTILKLIPDFH